MRKFRDDKCKKECCQNYPIKKIGAFFFWPISSVASSTDNFQGNNSKTVNICFVS